MRKVLLLAAVLVTGPALAQSIDDGSGDAIPAEALAAMMEKSVTHFRDVDRTRFRELKFKPMKGEINIRNEVIDTDIICGLVNTPNEYGGMTGYTVFTFYTNPPDFSGGRC